MGGDIFVGVVRNLGHFTFAVMFLHVKELAGFLEIDTISHLQAHLLHH